MVDVPEYDYLTTDKPFPRGELLIKTPYTISGYYNNTEDSSKAFEDGGW
jgi:long-chain acyl-CoA synthetase